MGLLFSLLYIVFLYLSPAYLFPGLGGLNLQVGVVAVSVLLTLLTVMQHGYPARYPQNTMLILLFGWVLLSRPLHGWFGGVLPAANDFTAFLVVFFLFAANVYTPLRLAAVPTVVVLIALFLCVKVVLAAHFGMDADTFLLMQVDDEGNFFGLPRARGTGSLADPNDLAQFLLLALVFLSHAWQKGKPGLSMLLVPMPGILLLYGIYLTHSRGGLLGVAAVAAAIFLLRGRKLLGFAGGAVVATILVILNFTGGRGMSITESGRTIVWGEAIAMFKSSPVWGVGYGLFLEHSELTAHNSFLLCLAELGLVGYFLWLGTIVLTWFQLAALTRQLKESPASQDLLAWTRTLQLALIAFLVTAWFLSRTYSPTLFLLLGLSVAIMAMARQRTGAEPDVVPLRRWAPITIGAQIATVIFAYLSIRISGFL
jgi:putative inorganic carbon (HCO3(-)) transporter